MKILITLITSLVFLFGCNNVTQVNSIKPPKGYSVPQIMVFVVDPDRPSENDSEFAAIFEKFKTTRTEVEKHIGPPEREKVSKSGKMTSCYYENISNLLLMTTRKGRNGKEKEVFKVVYDVRGFVVEMYHQIYTNDFQPVAGGDAAR